MEQARQLPSRQADACHTGSPEGPASGREAEGYRQPCAPPAHGPQRRFPLAPQTRSGLTVRDQHCRSDGEKNVITYSSRAAGPRLRPASPAGQLAEPFPGTATGLAEEHAAARRGRAGRRRPRHRPRPLPQRASAREGSAGGCERPAQRGAPPGRGRGRNAQAFHPAPQTRTAPRARTAPTSAAPQQEDGGRRATGFIGAAAPPRPRPGRAAERHGGTGAISGCACGLGPTAPSPPAPPPVWGGAGAAISRRGGGAARRCGAALPGRSPHGCALAGPRARRGHRGAGGA